MPRFFINAENISDGIVYLTKEAVEHIRVLRLKPGETITVCDSVNDHICRIIESVEKKFSAKIIESHEINSEPTVKLALLCALPKGERADYIAQKCTEAGADEIIFFDSERCVSRPDGSSLAKRLQRLQKIALEAAQQSGRGKIPRVCALDSFSAALERALASELPLMMHECGDNRISLKSALNSAGNISSCAIISGPEGGFEPSEAELAAKKGVRLCSMGSRIFRCETAPLAAAVALMYHTGNMD